MEYLIFTSLQEAESYQTQADNVLGYPEPLDSLSQVGGGTHAPLELGRAMHYAEVSKHQSDNLWALPKADNVNVPGTATVVNELPEGWLPEPEPMGE